MITLMERHISQDQARKELERIVNDSDSIEESLGNGFLKDCFLLNYRILHAQLKDGDKLKMEFKKRLENNIYTYNINVVLYPKDKNKIIISNTTEGITRYAKGYNGVLYNN
ncbi:hypothetical protein KAI32_01065 [Candidatus Pacearchaeota archaeon]|nr:hypothetical protein [Candidatus Pacearchaeota archaeon]